MIVHHKHTPYQRRPKNTIGGLNYLENRKKRLEDEVATLESEAQREITSCTVDHPLLAEIESARAAKALEEASLEEKQRKIVMVAALAEANASEAEKTQLEIDRLRGIIEQFKTVKASLLARSEMRARETYQMERDLLSLRKRANESGAIARHNAVLQRFNAATHQIMKKAREKQARAQKLRARIDLVIQDIQRKTAGEDDHA
jgi:hypothetical protein